MAKESDSAKKTSRRKEVAPLPEDAFASRQLSLFQGFLANTGDQREALSNAVDLWDSLPRSGLLWSFGGITQRRAPIFENRVDNRHY